MKISPVPIQHWRKIYCFVSLFGFCKKEGGGRENACDFRYNLGKKFGKLSNVLGPFKNFINRIETFCH